MTSPRHAHFIVFLTSDGYNEAGWRMHGFDGSDPIGLRSYLQATAICERGRLDAAFFADRLALTPFRVRAFPQTHHDPVQTLGALAMASERVGLIATASTTFSTPWDLARRFATLDHISAGRVGWNVVTTYDPTAAANFGVTLPEHDDRYARAGEFVEVVRRLWDSWEDGALIRDPATGIWADPERIHPAAFAGEYYSVAGALSVPRSPQGHPVLAQAGSSEAGVDLAGQTADVVFTPQRSIEAAIGFRERIDAAAQRHGRRAGDVRILPGLGYVLGSTEAEARERRRSLEQSVDPTFRWQMLATTAGLDIDRIDPAQPLSAEVAAGAPPTSFARNIVERALATGQPFGELAASFTGLPGGLEFTGGPDQLADLVAEWVDQGACDGFTLQPATVPEDLALFVDHVVPILQRRGLFRHDYLGRTLRDHLGLARPGSAGVSS